MSATRKRKQRFDHRRSRATLRPIRYMLCRESDSLPVVRVPSISLDYGTDETSGGAEFTLSERGMRFRSRWQFSIGTQLAVACVWDHPRLGRQRVTIEGIVVWSGPGADSGHETTLLFLELPDELKASLREFSHLLAE